MYFKRRGLRYGTPSPYENRYNPNQKPNESRIRNPIPDFTVIITISFGWCNSYFAFSHQSMKYMPKTQFLQAFFPSSSILSREKPLPQTSVTRVTIMKHSGSRSLASRSSLGSSWLETTLRMTSVG